jgi:large subunit ribosomal protein L4
MPAKKNEPANTKAKAVAPKASKADTAKAETKAKAAAKPTAAKATPTAKAAAPARPRAVARPVTRVARPAAPRPARPAEEPKREKREVAPSKPLPTAPAGHAPLIAADGSSSGSIELPAAFTKVTKNVATLFQAFLSERANARQATSATKNRARVSGGGAKPWRQKGTGRARQGSTRSPQWRHGGVVFGPNGRQYWQRIPEKMRKAAFGDAMSARAAQGRVLVVEGLKLDGERPRTRDVVSWLGKIGDTGNAVFVWNEIDEGAARAMANLPDLEVRTPSSLRLSDVIDSDTLLVMRPALDALAARAINAPPQHARQREVAKREAESREAASRDEAKSREPVTA